MISIIGVYPVKARQPVHLVELEIRNCQGPFALTEITQEDPSQPRSNWQVPYLEHILDAEGTRILADDFDASRKPELWFGNIKSIRAKALQVMAARCKQRSNLLVLHQRAPYERLLR